MGWLGWSERIALSTSIPAIELALEGRVEMLNAIFGGGESEQKPKEATRPMSPQLFDALFGGRA